MQQPLRFAIVGCGRIAQRHAEQVTRVGRLVAVCDCIAERAQQMAAAFGVTPFTDLGEMLEVSGGIDVVVICTPNGLHAEHSIQALQAGCHVLCEKPMAIHSIDCERMIAAAEAAGRHLVIVKQNRFNPPVVAVKNLLEKGQLGALMNMQINCYWNRPASYYASSWKGTRHLDGGTLYTQFSHFIDLACWLGGEVASVNAFTGNFQHQGVVDFEDTGVAIFRFSSGALGSVHFTVNSFEKNMEGSITLFCEKGTVKIGGQYLNELEYQQIKDIVLEGLPEGNGPNHYGTYTGSMSNHDKVYQNLVDVLLHGAPVNASALDGLQTVQLIEKIYVAAAKG